MADTLSIRRGQVQDIPALVELIATYRAEQNKPFPAAARSGAVQQFTQIVAGQPDTEDSPLWVAVYNDNNPVGYLNAHLGSFPLLGGSELYISDLLVATARRGQGIGSALLKQAEHFARQKGCVRLMLNNIKREESYSRGFYPAHGFSERDGVANMVKRL